MMVSHLEMHLQAYPFVLLSATGPYSRRYELESEPRGRFSGGDQISFVTVTG
jgi:hypothetical protein